MARHLTRALTCAVSLTVTVAAGIGGAVPVSAAQRGSVGVAVGHFDPKVPDSMGHFILALTPGATYADDVIVTNHNTAPFPVYAYPADAGTSDASGEYYGTRSDPLRKAGAWVTSSVSSLTVPAKSQVRVAFVVRVPLDATPGDHLAAMVFEPEYPETGSGSMGVSSIIRAAMPILIQIPGPGDFQVSLSAATIQPREGTGTSTVEVSLANAGDRKGKPVLSVRLVGPFGYARTEPPPGCASTDGRFCGHLDYVLPGDLIHFPFPWSTDLAAGDYTIIVTATFGQGEKVVFSTLYHLGAPLVGTPLTPRAAPRSNAARDGSNSGWLGRLGRVGVAAAILLMLTAFALLGVGLRNRRCTHCRRLGLIGRFTAQDYQEIAGCASCRAKAMERVRVVLCRTCYRTHVAKVTVVRAASRG